jgi:hypothetical protein
VCSSRANAFPPLTTQLVLNNFSKDSFHLKLLATMFQNMFPSIDIEKVCDRRTSCAEQSENMAWPLDARFIDSAPH